MTANLVDNARTAVEGYIIKSVHGWSDSTEHFIGFKGSSTVKQFSPK